MCIFFLQGSDNDFVPNNNEIAANLTSESNFIWTAIVILDSSFDVYCCQIVITNLLLWIQKQMCIYVGSE